MNKLRQFVMPLALKGSYRKRFCPACGNILYSVIVAPSVTYVTHANRLVCVIDNLPAVNDGTP